MDKEYIKQLEQQNEELREKLAASEQCVAGQSEVIGDYEQAFAQIHSQIDDIKVLFEKESHEATVFMALESMQIFVKYSRKSTQK